MKSVNKYPSWGDMMMLLGIFLVVTVGAGLINFLLIKSNSVSEGFGSFLTYTIQFGIVAVFALYQRFMYLPKGEPLLKVGLGRINIVVILWSVILITVIGVVIEPVIMLFPDAYMETLKNVMSKGFWMIVTSVVCAPILEELLFRGIIQESLSYKYGAWRSIVISASMFGVIHVLPQQVVNAFFIGLVLGYVYYLTQSLMNVVIIHFINNAIAYVMFIFAGDDTRSIREVITNDVIYYIIYGLCVIIMVEAGIKIYRTVKRREQELKAIDETKVYSADNIDDN